MACLKVSMCCRIYNGDVRLAHASAEPDKAKSTKGRPASDNEVQFSIIYECAKRHPLSS